MKPRQDLVDYFIAKFSHKMNGSTSEMAKKWVDGIGELSEYEREAIMEGINPYISKTDTLTHKLYLKLCNMELDFLDHDLKLTEWADEGREKIKGMNTDELNDYYLQLSREVSFIMKEKLMKRLMGDL